MDGSRGRGKRITTTAFLLFATLAASRDAGAQNVSVSGIDSLRVRANLQPQFDATTVDDVDASTEWRIRRARVALRMFVAGWIRGDVEAGFGQGRARLTDGYVRLDFDPAVRLQAGQFKRPFDVLELASSRELLVIERDGAPRGTAGPTPNGLVVDLGYASRDIGATWSGAFERVSATAGFFNGSDDNDSDDNDGKQLAVRVAAEVGDGWELSGAWSAKRVTVLEIDPDLGDDEAEWYNAGELAVVGGGYAEPGLKAFGQVMFGENFASDLGGAVEDASFFAAQGIIAYNVPAFDSPYVIAWEPAGRLGWTDPHTDVDDDEAALLTAGINLYHRERVKTQAGIDVLAPGEGDAETAFRLQMTIGF